MSSARVEFKIRGNFLFVTQTDELKGLHVEIIRIDYISLIDYSERKGYAPGAELTLFLQDNSSRTFEGGEADQLYKLLSDQLC